MTTAQKVIKYLALAFAMLLTVSIISGILGALYALSGVLGLKKDNEIIKGEMSMVDFENGDIATLDIDLTFTNLIIKKGDFLKAETNNSNINCKQNNQNLQIKEKNHGWFLKNNKGDLVVYIPENIKFEKVKINAGAGKVEIENINTKKLDFDLGAGETKIENLNVTNDCKIEGGAGRLSILSGNINDLDLDMGVGKVEIVSTLTGSSKINAGIGSLELNLQGPKESYKIKADKGIGSIKINGTEISDDSSYGEGENDIKIDGGIGSIKVDFKGE
ncbi:MAG: DUF4097 family beta strand repeat protein [Clostridia bacterium]|nr:DUF4097 family beta strand repeat protein [Clostridia bacterium]